jgi:paired amphipathic helix protein Sin3a
VSFIPPYRSFFSTDISSNSTLLGSPDDNVDGEDELAIRICTRTYRLFYVAHTEDILSRRCSLTKVTEAFHRLEADNARKRAWLEKFIAREPAPASSINEAVKLSPSATAKTA